ncbi:MAG: hypothetical protein WAO98_10040 [Alphaproteobacteria bacterium]
MEYAPQHAALILSEVDKIRNNNESESMKVRRLWVTLAFVHANSIANILRNTIGTSVYSGPFKGMKLAQSAMTGAYGPTLLGTYEHELHPIFEQAIAKKYKQVLNIGCSFGYYTVGLALRMPDTIVHSFDIDPEARKACTEMVALNGVQDRVKIEGEFRGEDFAKYPAEGTLVLMDIEGFETQLLDPSKYPALKKMDILVELHDVFDSEISKKVLDRFTESHDIQLITHTNMMFDFKQITGPVRYIDPFDDFLINWENRDGPTPWAMMTPKK